MILVMYGMPSLVKYGCDGGYGQKWRVFNPIALISGCFNSHHLINNSQMFKLLYLLTRIICNTFSNVYHGMKDG